MFFRLGCLLVMLLPTGDTAKFPISRQGRSSASARLFLQSAELWVTSWIPDGALTDSTAGGASHTDYFYARLFIVSGRSLRGYIASRSQETLAHG